jgi:2-C-methyl-D-erythritol 4-phosphate cytidylyltransferase / 2-C-methyl-D-erythritol 2,4-cyclodiphosphate synthase
MGFKRVILCSKFKQPLPLQVLARKCRLGYGAQMKVTAIIVAAGKGERAGGDIPKQFQHVAGAAILAHAYDSLAKHAASIIIVIASGQETLAEAALAGRRAQVVIGGAERQESVRSGLEAAIGADHVLIHDAARPFVPPEVINRLLEALQDSAGAVPAIPIVDTLARLSDGLGDVVDRAGLVRIQTPQAFHYAAIMQAHEAWSGTPATDDAQMLRALGKQVAVVKGSSRLEKITQPGDIDRIEMNMISRTGFGFDVHRLESGEDLWLCGVQIPHDKGLSGHSDADVALHALTDAMLGAAAAGDIGDHFPPSDPQWRGAASARFVEYARDLIACQGGIIDHVDVTIICEAPKIGPHRSAMRSAVAEMLQLPLSRISVKATTTEQLGLTGRGEGIAAQAIATIRLRSDI